MAVLDVVLLIALALLCALAALSTVFQLPGTWLVVAAATAYGAYYHWQIITGWTLAGLVGLAGLAELLELVTGAWFTRRGGGSRRAAWWGLVGGILGAFLLSIPVPIIGTIIGAAVGCFCGALVAELSQQRHAAEAAKVGLLAAVGRTVGTVLKVGAAIVLAGGVMATAIMGQMAGGQ
ncbi:MAG: DUF456 family protein [Phycisphaerae bacterium]